MPTITEATPYGELTISGLVFSVPRPYEAGHILTEGEASALNQVFGENLRNNYAQKIRGKVEEYRKANNLGEDDEISAGVLDKDVLDADFEEYASKYEFGVRTGGSGPRAPADPIGKEAYRIAWDKLKVALKGKNYDVASISKEQKDKLIKDAIEKYPDIRAEAERRVNAGAEIAIGDLTL